MVNNHACMATCMCAHVHMHMETHSCGEKNVCKLQLHLLHIGPICKDLRKDGSGFVV